MNYPKIAIGCPVKNREWILPKYLKALDNIVYPNKEYIFLENNSSDKSAEILFANVPGSNYKIKRITTDSSVGEDRTHYGLNFYEHLANIRNKFLDLFLNSSNASYLFSCDSDIIVPPNILEELLRHANENTIVGCAISNITGKELDGKIPGNFMRLTPQKLMVHVMDYPKKGLLDVDVIGACYLIPRKAIEDGIKYAPNVQGEDIPFCLSAKQKGYRLLVDFNTSCKHEMKRS